jgi:ABC-type Mn2+/Zn2+ transport system permease subunit
VRAAITLLSPLDLVELAFLRRALLELALLAVAGGLLGAWIVLRRLAFFSHAVGTATFPGLVVADAAGFSPRLAALAVALGYAGGVGSTDRERGGAATGLLLVAALAGGIVLASDVFRSGAVVDRLLFGTILGLDGSDLAFSAAAAMLALGATVALGRIWTAVGFDPDAAPRAGLPARAADALLLLLIAAAAVAAIPAVGALLVTSLFVVPAATARRFTVSVPALLAASVALAGAEGAAGLYLSYCLDAPPGPSIAALGVALYGLVVLAPVAGAPRGAAGRAA